MSVAYSNACTLQLAFLVVIFLPVMHAYLGLFTHVQMLRQAVRRCQRMNEYQRAMAGSDTAAPELDWEQISREVTIASRSNAAPFPASFPFIAEMGCTAWFDDSLPVLGAWSVGARMRDRMDECV
jgi:hypothetical protein